MATLASPSSPPSPTPLRRRTKSCARKCERACCAVATYFPLAFVYSLSTWAAWVEAGTGLTQQGSDQTKSWLAKCISLVGIILYLLLNASYTVAVFTDPGSTKESPTAKPNAQYSSLPTSEPSNDIHCVQHITVSSTGSPRYCKKCHMSKPDRTHHCSTCQRCVLKMDHHCPWLATCLGLHNYKAFVLFLIYTCLFSWICFAGSARWVFTEIFEQNQYLEEFAPINVILLAVISGIIGLVLTGFTAWHLYLCIRGQTTIECLEKTRYLTGVRKQIERQRQDRMNGHTRTGSHGVAETLQRAGEQILEFHANAVPGASRLEEGEEHNSPVPSVRNPTFPAAQPRASSPSRYADSPAQQALRQTYSSIEDQRERDRYSEYLDDKESEKLPNAFDLGWRRNLAHLFGPRPLLWFLPVCNTTGDGWRWEVSPKWLQASEETARRREGGITGGTGGVGLDGTYERDRDPDLENGRGLSMRTLQRPGHASGKAKQRREFEDGEAEGYEVSSDEDTDDAWEGERGAEEDSKKGNGDRGWQRWE